MNEQTLEQQSQYEAVSLTCEVSDEALEATGGALGGTIGCLYPGHMTGIVFRC